MTKIDIVNTDSKPKCPHCEKELDKIEKIEKIGFTGQHIVYICPNCKKLLSIGYN